MSEEICVLCKNIGKSAQEETCKRCRCFAGEFVVAPEVEALPEMVEALKAVVEAESQMCHRCQGNGRLWADGKAHFPTYTGATVFCPQCGGEGSILADIDGLKEKCAEALKKAGVE